MKKTAIITGITGQDGSYLAELLLKKGYIVHGIKRRSSVFNTKRIDHLIEQKSSNFHLHFGDMTDALSLNNLVSKILPDEIYNLAAMSHVKVSFETPEYVANVDGIGTLRLLEIIKSLKKRKKIKFYQASTSEMYGNSDELLQSELTPFRPRSPYAVAKLYSHWITINYREAYNIFACSGILFNHESPRRGETFVTRKITLGIANIINGSEDKIVLGNLSAKRDWGHAKDYVKLMWKILQQKKPEDWVIGNGFSYSIRDFLVEAFGVLGIKIKFLGKGEKEIGIVDHCMNSNFHLEKNRTIVEVSSKYFRPTEVNHLLADAKKARDKLNWKPEYNFKRLVKEMVLSDLNYVTLSKS